MKHCNVLIILCLIVTSSYILWWFNQESVSHGRQELRIDFSDATQPPPSKQEVPLRIAVSAMTSPQTTETLYRDLLELIGLKIGKPVTFIQRPTYEEIDRMLEENLIDIAFICSGSYVFGHDRYGLELLAIPIIAGSRVYHSDIIVAEDSPFNSLESLRDKRFAFTSASSNSGCLAPTYLLALRQETPERFFSNISFTKTHDKAVHAVAHGLADGAAVDSLILSHMLRENDPSARKVRVVERSQDFGMPPVVMSKELPSQLKQRLRQVFLTIHEDQAGQSLLKKLGIDYFTLANDVEYDGIRTMARLCTVQ
nr:phosphate/phosphite/phosphonate ABC transporter substrate-binding protein [uncultured Desulfuromonas sp.]